MWLSKELFFTLAVELTSVHHHPYAWTLRPQSNQPDSGSRISYQRLIPRPGPAQPTLAVQISCQGPPWRRTRACRKRDLWKTGIREPEMGGLGLLGRPDRPSARRGGPHQPSGQHMEPNRLFEQLWSVVAQLGT